MVKTESTDWKKIDEIDFNTAKKIEANIGSHLMDMDKIAFNLMSNIKGVSTEMEYKSQLDTNNRIYITLMIIGILMILAVVLSI